MSLFAELKRRNVFRVAVAYVIVGWLVMQIGEVMSPALHLPEWSNSFLAWLLILGFPVAMLFAWVYELTPEGIRRERDVNREASIAPRTGQKLNIAIIVLLLLALAYFVWESRVADRPSPENRMAATQEDPGAIEASEQITENRRSIAVLPFANRSQREEDLFFTDGIHDDLLTQLARIDDLKVISRTSVMGYRDTDKNLRQIGEELGVATVLEGGVQRAGDQVRINVQLIDAGTDEHLWAQTYDRELAPANIFAIQSEIAAAIADALQAELSPQQRARLAKAPTNNMEAYDHFLLARQHYNRQDWESLDNAVQELQHATRLDPEFQQAWTLMARTYARMLGTGASTLAQIRGPWTEAYTRAASLNEHSSDLYWALGQFRMHAGEDGAQQALQKALDHDPNNPELMSDMSTLLRFESRPEEARTLLLAARELDPMSTQVWWGLGRTWLMMNQNEKALEAFARIRAIDPSNSNGWGPAAGPYMATGQYANAMAFLVRGWQIDPEDLDIPNWIVRQAIDIGMLEFARTLAEHLERRDPAFTFTQANLAMLDVLDGDLNSATQKARVYFGMENANHRWGSDDVMSGVLRMTAMESDQATPALEVLLQAYPELNTPSPEVDADLVQKALDVAGLQLMRGDEKVALPLLNAVLELAEQPYALSGDRNRWRVTAEAQALALLGKHDAAMESLERLVETGWRLMWHWSIELNPNFDGLKERADYQALVRFLEGDMARQRQEVEAAMASGDIPALPEANT